MSEDTRARGAHGMPGIHAAHVAQGAQAPQGARSRADQRLRDLAVLRRVRDRMEREFAQPLDVEALARGAHMSAGHLSREFRAAFGESPYGYLMTRRVERAMALLRRGDVSVTEACFAVGCSSLGTFSTRFRELVGMSPSEYRRRAALAVEGVHVDGLPACVAKQVTRPVREARRAPAAPVATAAPAAPVASVAPEASVRNREAPVGEDS